MQQLSTILPRLFFQLPPHVGREKRTGKSDIGHASINHLQLDDSGFTFNTLSCQRKQNKKKVSSYYSCLMIEETGNCDNSVGPV